MRLFTTIQAQWVMRRSDLIRWGQLAEKVFSKFTKLLYAYVAIVGIFGFSCFIVEESVQMLTFANFSADDAGKCDLILENCNRMDQMADHLETINTVFMWLQPVQMYAYDDFVISTRQYVRTQRQVCLARAPELFVNQSVDMQFSYRSARRSTDAPEWLLTNGRITAAVGTRPKETTTRITGILEKTDNGFFVRNRPPDE